jgi:hypothetical protein
VCGILAGLAFMAPACGGATTATLTDIQSVEVLQQRFNADAGASRVVLLLSPT